MVKAPPRIKVTDTYYVDWAGNIASSSFNASIEYLKNLEQELQRMFPDATNFILESDSIGYDGAREYYIEYQRLETDNEYNKRVELEADIAAKRKQTEKDTQAKEIELLRKLKKKYPNEANNEQ